MTLFSVQVLSLLLYNFTNGNPARVRTAKAILYVYLAAIVGIILLEFTEGGSNMEALLAAVSSPKLEYLPLLGWIKGACFAFIAGNLAQAGLFAGLTVLAVAACVLVFVRGNVDYFEDVLQSTETAQEQRDALKKAADSGMMTTNNGKKRKYKVRTTASGAAGARIPSSISICVRRGAEAASRLWIQTRLSWCWSTWAWRLSSRMFGAKRGT